MKLVVQRYASVTSTMDLAAQAARQGAAEGLVIVADHQAAGRGRRGRSWSSPPGAGLYLSVVLRPPLAGTAPELVSFLTLGTGVAVRTAILHASGWAPQLKWPNDVVAAHRKLAGILAEGVAIGTPEQTVILGIGINVRDGAHPAEIAARATSLEAELTRPIDPALLLEEILVAVPAVYLRLQRGGSDDILREWRAAAPSAIGAAVEWDAADGPRRGTTAGIDDSGALLIRTSSAVERVVAGEIRWL
jgi:BirA family transcriptional regulator, biotin operon repressor / biotin---[acetyl-CoA-carboxylase] ligase